VYLSFRIQYLALQVSVPVGFIILNTVVFGSYLGVMKSFNRLYRLGDLWLWGFVWTRIWRVL